MMPCPAGVAKLTDMCRCVDFSWLVLWQKACLHVTAYIAYWRSWAHGFTLHMAPPC